MIPALPSDTTGRTPNVTSDVTDFPALIETSCRSEVEVLYKQLQCGNTQYRSLHSLTEQIEHQYHGRFIIELLQNAIDQLNKSGLRDAPGRVVFLFDPDAEAHGTLYVANDGRPMTDDDCRAIARLGQSSKDPEDSVGNKGIGFRSVLEACVRPELWSRQAEGESGPFDGCRMRFSADFPKRLADAAVALLRRDATDAEFDEGLAHDRNWSAATLSEYRGRWRDAADDLRNQFSFVSPYNLPLVATLADANIEAFAADGYSTVVKLPMNDAEATAKVQALLGEDAFGERDVLFLDGLSALRIQTPWRAETIRRDVGGGRHGAAVVTLSSTNEGTEQRFACWQRQIGGDEDRAGREQLAEACAKLPGKWPNVRRACVAIAVPLDLDDDGEQEGGAVSVFLPTRLHTGVAASLNAPFYASMDRTKVDFGKPLNELLIRQIGRLAAQVITECLVGGVAEVDGNLTASLLCPVVARDGREPASRTLLESIESALRECLELENGFAAVVVVPVERFEGGGCVRDWASLADACLPPERDEGARISVDDLRRFSLQDCIATSLDGRIPGLKRLAKRWGTDLSMPAAGRVAAIKAVAARTWDQVGPPLPVQAEANDTDTRAKEHPTMAAAEVWRRFFEECAALLPASETSVHPLASAEVVPTADRLCAPVDTPLFFAPQRIRRNVAANDSHDSATDDDDDKAGTDANDPGDPDELSFDVPRLLRREVAFVEPAIAPAQSVARNYLTTGITRPIMRYDAEAVFTAVVKPLLQAMNGTVAHRSRKAGLCKALLQLTMQLLQTGKGSDALIDELGNLRVPCEGGWLPCEEAMFGAGWDGTLGQQVREYFDGLPQVEGAAARLLCAPSSKHWPKNARPSMVLLERAGVFNGLKLVPVPSATRAFWMEGRANCVRIPDPPEGIDGGKAWAAWQESVWHHTAPLLGYYEYRLNRVLQIPGMFGFRLMKTRSRTQLMLLLLASMPRWANWRQIGYRRHPQGQRGGMPSLVWTWLKTMPWLTETPAEGGRRFNPSNRWLLDSAVADSAFASHLPHVPASIRRYLLAPPAATKILCDLGMPRLGEDGTDDAKRLVQALADAVANGRVTDTNRPAFDKHLRLAWRQLAAADGLPRLLVISRGDRLETIDLDALPEIVYLPDVSGFVEAARDAKMPVIAIPIEHGRRLREAFVAASDMVVPCSRLRTTWRVDGSDLEEDCAAGGLALDATAWRDHAMLAVAIKSDGDVTQAGLIKLIQRLRGLKVIRASEPIELRWHLREATDRDTDEIIHRHVTEAVYAAQLGCIVVHEPTTSDVAALFATLAQMPTLQRVLNLVLPTAVGNGHGFDGASAVELWSLPRRLYGDVEKLWLGDDERIANMMPPLLAFFHIDTTNWERLPRADEWPERLADAGLAVAPSELVRLCREAANDAQLGRGLYELVRAAVVDLDADLDAFNATLVDLDPPRPIVVNDELDDQFAAARDAVRLPLFAIVRADLHATSRPVAWQAVADAIDKATPDDSWRRKTWQLGLPTLIDYLVREVAAVDPGCGAACSRILGNTVHDEASLVAAVQQAGLSPDEDPAEVLTTNETLLSTMALRLALAVQEWASHSSEASATAEAAALDTSLLWLDGRREQLRQGAGLLHRMTKVQAWQGLISVVEGIEATRNVAALIAATENPAEADKALGVTRKEVDGARKRHQRAQDHAESVTHRLIYGKEYAVTDTDGVMQAFDRAVDIAKLDGVDLDLMAQTNKPASADVTGESRGATGPGSAGNGPPTYTDDATKRLIGLIGERLALIVLKAHYGRCVSAKSWASTNVSKVHKHCGGDDRLGYDFHFRHKYVEYFVEVKATTGDDTTFEMGPTELAHASSVAGLKTKRYVVLRVCHALGVAPTFEVLPNPYEDHEGKVYAKLRSGVKFRYRRG